MLKAIDEYGNRLYSFDLGERPEQLLMCPECGSQVIFKKGTLKIAHFAHKPNSDCYYGTGESEAHMLMKKNFYEKLKRKHPALDVVIEDGTFNRRRADLSIRGKAKNVVVEFQASKITTEEIIERTMDYNNQGFYVLWIFHISRVKFECFFEKGERRMAEELRGLERKGLLQIMSDGSEIRKVKFVGGRGTKTMRKCVWENPSNFDFIFCEMEFRQGVYLRFATLDYAATQYPNYEEFKANRKTHTRLNNNFMYGAGYYE